MEVTRAQLVQLMQKGESHIDKLTQEDEDGGSPPSPGYVSGFKAGVKYLALELLLMQKD
jgi:hypothetical protein